MITLFILLALAIHIGCWLMGAYKDWLYFGDKIDYVTWATLFIPLAPIALCIAVSSFVSEQVSETRWNNQEDKSFSNFLKVGF